MINWDIENEGFKALTEYIGSCTVVITSTTEGFEHGSGVAVRYANQDYIITAAHVLDNEPDKNILTIGRSDKPFIEVPKNRLKDAVFNSSYGNPLSATPTHICIEERILGKSGEDIAALKVRNTAESLPYTIFHNLTDQGKTKINIGEIVNIYGFPGEIGQQVKNRVTKQKGYAVFPHIEQRKIRSNSDYPDNSDPEVYIIIDFACDDKSCDPKGMSGGGIWSIPKLQEGQLWSSDKSQLLGIQSAFHRNSKLLKAVRLERILSLFV